MKFIQKIIRGSKEEYHKWPSSEEESLEKKDKSLNSICIGDQIEDAMMDPEEKHRADVYSADTAFQSWANVHGRKVTIDEFGVMVIKYFKNDDQIKRLGQYLYLMSSEG